MRPARKGLKAPRARLRTTLSGTSKPQVTNLLAVNLIGAAATTATKWPQGWLCLAFSAAS